MHDGSQDLYEQFVEFLHDPLRIFRDWPLSAR